MSDLRIMENWLFDDTVQVRASSEDPSFPVSNLSSFLRSDVWRSYGYFKIISSNKYFDFKASSVGAQLTVILPEGEYTPEELAQALEDGLNIADAGHTYTVTYSRTTGRFTISTSGSYLSLLFVTGTNAASSVHSAIGFASSDQTGSLSYVSTVIALHTEESIVADLGSFGDAPVDSCVLFFESGTGKNFSENAVVKLQANAVDLWDSPAVNVTLSYDQTYETYSHFFSSTQSYRYWRVVITDAANPDLYVEIPKLVLSKSVAFSQVPQSGFKHSLQDTSKLESTSYGQVYADVYSQLKNFEFSYAAFSDSDLELLWKLFQRIGKTTPVAVALDTQATLYDKDRFLCYSLISSDFSAQHKFYSYFDTAITFREAM